jgi:hypothetical protein
LGLGGAGAAGTFVNEILTDVAGTGLAGLFAGVGRYGGVAAPIKIFPLARMGAPWTAALRGFGETDRTSEGFLYEVGRVGDQFLKRFNQRWVDAKKATAFLYEQWVKPLTLEQLTALFLSGGASRAC